MKQRDNFSSKVILAAKLRAAYICSRPECRSFTIAPSLNNDILVQYQGKIAHITAAAPKGPRYDEGFSNIERSSISNAIFLCSNCADLIDKNDGKDYSADTLRDWNHQHHKWVTENLNKSASNQPTQVFINNQAGSITAKTAKNKRYQ